MSTTAILQRSWRILWRYRALWVLGMALALFAGNTIYMGRPQRAEQSQPGNVQVVLPNDMTVRLPGEGLRIDLSAPGGNRLDIEPGGIGPEDAWLSNLVRQIQLSDVLAVGIEAAVLFVLAVIFGVLARYVAETAVIRMVDETETTGRHLTLREGLRLGWSVRAARLFLIDLMVGLGVVALVSLMIPLVVGWATITSLGGVVAMAGTLPMLGLLGFAVLFLGVIVSLFMQPVRRACAADGLGVFASIGAGARMLGRHLRQVGMVWLIWIAIRILWVPLGVLIALMIAPFLLTSLMAGLLAGGVSTGLVAAVSAPFVHGVTPWIMGGIVGLPIFVLVLILPLLLISGWVEIYKSSMWTLTYRELRGTERSTETVEPSAPLSPAAGTAD